MIGGALLQKQVLGHKYEIKDPAADLIGRGAMGGVYRGRDIETDQPVAIKALMPDLIDASDELIARFLREGEALRELNHPNIVSVIDTITEDDPLPGNPEYFIVMELIEGGSLEQLLQQRKRLTLEEALEIGLDLADALTRTHRLGIIHRDLKPGNVLMSDDNKPLLTDFGIALIGKGSSLTEDGTLIGTIDYMSPEALNARVLDERADIWSYGVLLWEMLVGQPPFRRDTIGATLAAILSDSLPDLREYSSDAPVSLSRLLSLTLEKDRRNRIPSIRFIGAELEAILQGRVGRDLAKWHEIIASGRQDEVKSVTHNKEAIFVDTLTAHETVNMMIAQSTDRGEQIISQPSLAFASTISEDLDLDYAAAALMLRSALYHSEQYEPWMAYFDSDWAAIEALKEYYEAYPPPEVRGAIVDALKEINDENSDEILNHIGTHDDSPAVRTKAALAYASNGNQEAVIRETLITVKNRDDSVSLSTLAALVDTYGPPDDVDLLLKFQLTAVLAKQRWKKYRRIVRKQSFRVGRYGVLMALIGAATPIMMNTMDLEGYQTNLDAMGLPAWLVGLMVLIGLYGFLQGLASGFFPGLSDALWIRGGSGVGRLLWSSPSGLVYALALFLFLGLQESAPFTQRILYFPATIMLGLIVGALLSIVVPVIGTYRSRYQQILRMVLISLICMVINVPYLYFLFPDPGAYVLFSRLLFVGALPLFFGLPFLLRQEHVESLNHVTSDSNGAIIINSSKEEI